MIDTRCFRLTILTLCAALLLATAPAVAATLATPEPPEVPEPDAPEDREPVIIAQRIGTTDYVVAAWMKGREDPQIRVASSEAFPSGFGSWTAKTLCAFENGVCVSGDPYLAANARDEGIAPKRVYLAGTSYKRTATGRRGENQISVWSSDNGGRTWGEPTALSHGSGSPWFADKPSIAVSSESQTLGKVYVAHMLFDDTPGCEDIHTCLPSKIYVYRSDEDGQFTESPEILDDLGKPHSPIVIVDPSRTGWVYLVWLDSANTINVAYSMDQGANFSSTYSTSAGTLLGPGGHDRIGDGGGIFARSMLMARFNPEAGTIGITWHAREPNGSHGTDVKFISWDPESRTFGARRTVTDSQSISSLDAPTAGNQWNPAIAYDSNGDYLVTYYDTREATQNSTEFNYFVRAAYLDKHGDRMQPPIPDTKLSPQPSNLLSYGPGYRRVGEYQDVWNLFGTWYAAFIQISPSGQGDAAVVRIPDTPPTASFTSSCTGRTCTFDATSSTDDHGIVSWTWTLGDGASKSGQVVTHTYATNGSRTVVLTVTDTAGQTAQQSRTVDAVDLQPPTNVLATATSGTVSIEWIPAVGADGYDVERKVAGAFWTVVQTVTGGTQWSASDTPGSTSGVVLYRVVARAGTSRSSPSNRDVAYVGTFTDDPVLATAPYTTVKAAHIIELRRAVNGLYEAIDLDPVYSGGDLNEAALRGQLVDDAHFTALLSKLNAARTNPLADLPPVAFRDVPAQGQLIRRTQIEDLRNGVK